MALGRSRLQISLAFCFLLQLLLQPLQVLQKERFSLLHEAVHASFVFCVLLQLVVLLLGFIGVVAEVVGLRSFHF